MGVKRQINYVLLKFIDGMKMHPDLHENARYLVLMKVYDKLVTDLWMIQVPRRCAALEKSQMLPMV